jgi:hypothetical protein
MKPAEPEGEFLIQKLKELAAEMGITLDSVKCMKISTKQIIFCALLSER